MNNSFERSKNTTIEWYTPKYIINKINYKNKRYMKKIKAKLQKMRYSLYLEEEYECVCLVDNSCNGGEFTMCGNAIPDSNIEYDGFEAVGDEFDGSIKEITCPNCLRRIQYIKSLK